VVGTAPVCHSEHHKVEHQAEMHLAEVERHALLALVAKALQQAAVAGRQVYYEDQQPAVVDQACMQVTEQYDFHLPVFAGNCVLKLTHSGLVEHYY